MEDNVNEKNYNHLFLCGDLHINDERYCEMMGLDPSLAGTPEINNKFLESNPDNKAFLNKRLASHGLLKGDEDAKE